MQRRSVHRSPPDRLAQPLPASSLTIDHMKYAFDAVWSISPGPETSPRRAIGSSPWPDSKACFASTRSPSWDQSLGFSWSVPLCPWSSSPTQATYLWKSAVCSTYPDFRWCCRGASLCDSSSHSACPTIRHLPLSAFYCSLPNIQFLYAHSHIPGEYLSCLI